MRTITTAPGLGDVLWVFMKLVNQPEKFDFIFPVEKETVADKDNVQTRAFQLEVLLPDLMNSSIHKVIKFGRQIRPYAHRGTWAELNGRQEMIIEANSHLEMGRRIEDFLPDLDTSFIIDFKTSNENRKEAVEILWKITGGKICGIYTSNHAKSRESWLIEEWVEFLNLIKKNYPEYKFVFIGAEYDWPLTGAIASHFAPEDYAVCVNEDLGTTIEVLKRLDLAVTFQSGISIINELIGARQTVMLYWDDQKHRNIIEAWPDKKRIANGQYKGAIFCPPEKIFQWLVQFNKL